MALTSGTRLGAYEVTVQIGVGGMGEVYRAIDTNVKRAVATRKTGAISNLLFSSFGVSTNTAFERLKFIHAKPVIFRRSRTTASGPSDNGGSTSYKTAAFRDKDGPHPE